MTGSRSSQRSRPGPRRPSEAAAGEDRIHPSACGRARWRRAARAETSRTARHPIRRLALWRCRCVRASRRSETCRRPRCPARCHRRAKAAGGCHCDRRRPWDATSARPFASGPFSSFRTGCRTAAMAVRLTTTAPCSGPVEPTTGPGLDTPWRPASLRSSKGSSSRELRGRLALQQRHRGDPYNLIQFVLA